MEGCRPPWHWWRGCPDSGLSRGLGYGGLGGGGQLTLSWLAGQLSAGAGLLWGQGQSSQEGVGRERREPFWMDGCLDGRQAPRASCTPPSSGEPEGRGHNPPGLPAPTLTAGLPQAVAAREKEVSLQDSQSTINLRTIKFLQALVCASSSAGLTRNLPEQGLLCLWGYSPASDSGPHPPCSCSLRGSNPHPLV